MNDLLTERAEHIWMALPQTQCTRCGYPDCKAYAVAIDKTQAQINQCPPGGQEGIARLAKIMGQDVQPLNPDNGIEGVRHVAFIDENWCIGCTLCIKACPVDAIVGATKLMHTVIESACTGCELCLPACPVDCIELENASGHTKAWQAWSVTQATDAKNRYIARTQRLQTEKTRREQKHLQSLQTKAADLSAHSQITDPVTLNKKQVLIEAALTRARARLGKN